MLPGKLVWSLEFFFDRRVLLFSKLKLLPVRPLGDAGPLGDNAPSIFFFRGLLGFPGLFGDFTPLGLVGLLVPRLPRGGSVSGTAFRSKASAGAICCGVPDKNSPLPCLILGRVKGVDGMTGLAFDVSSSAGSDNSRCLIRGD